MPVSTRITGSPPDGEESTQTASRPDPSTTGRSSAASSPAYPVDGLTPNIAACCSCSAEPQTTTVEGCDLEPRTHWSATSTRHRLDERLVGERVVERREHQVLPDQQPELVAAVVERVGLVRRDAGHPDQVQPQPHRLVERGQVARRPHGTAAEDPHAVDPEVEGAVGRTGSRRSGTRRGPTTSPSMLHVVEPRRAVGVRPPELDVGDLEAPPPVELDHAGGALQPGRSRGPVVR